MSSKNIVLITGASRGLGRGFVSAFLQRSETTVVAAVRDTASRSSIALNDLPKADGSSLIVIKIDSASESDPSTAVKALKENHNIEHLDIVIANAGISHSFQTILQSSSGSIQDHFAINTVAPIVLLQATAPLLKASPNGRPRFIAISSVMGSISGMDVLEGLPPLSSPYGASKAALNWFIRKAHFEESWLTCFAIHPGVVQTDMVVEFSGSLSAAESMGAIPVEKSVEGMCKVIDSATRDVGGTFQSYKSIAVPW